MVVSAFGNHCTVFIVLFGHYSLLAEFGPSNWHQDPTEAKIHFIGATYFHIVDHRITCTEDLASLSAS